MLTVPIASPLHSLTPNIPSTLLPWQRRAVGGCAAAPDRRLPAGLAGGGGRASGRGIRGERGCPTVRWWVLPDECLAPAWVPGWKGCRGRPRECGVQEWCSAGQLGALPGCFAWWQPCTRAAASCPHAHPPALPACPARCRASSRSCCPLQRRQRAARVAAMAGYSLETFACQASCLCCVRGGYIEGWV